MSSIFVCKECGYESNKYMGRCLSCLSWNSFYEEKVIKKGKETKVNSVKNDVKKLNEIIIGEEIRIDTGFKELNKVYGGGIVEGSLTLFGGEPGIGKSTLIMQMCDNLAKHGTVIYISGEESESQVKLRCDRLGIDSHNILFLNETNIDEIENKLDNLKPKFCIIDSIQTMQDIAITSSIGSVSQVKEVTNRLMYIAKNKNITTIVIGHVTKEGTIAGPRVLEHMVDTVIYIEGDRFSLNRIVRSVKNRFGSTNEIGIFEMQDKGLKEVTNLSEMFLTDSKLPGSAIFATIEGNSTILLEVQALTSHSYYNMPRRVANGLDFNRLNMLIAILEKRCNVNLSTVDIYVNVIGGIKIDEPAVDLAVIMSIMSSYRNIYLDNKCVFLAEVGLTGELRAVNNFDKRAKEIEKLGYNTIIVSTKQKNITSKCKIASFNTIEEIITKFMKKT